jgi:hypothetical protein
MRTAAGAGNRKLIYNFENNLHNFRALISYGITVLCILSSELAHILNMIEPVWTF